MNHNPGHQTHVAAASCGFFVSFVSSYLYTRQFRSMLPDMDCISYTRADRLRTTLYFLRLQNRTTGGLSLILFAWYLYNDGNAKKLTHFRNKT